MKILCVCTSGKDRSPIMAEYLKERGHDSYAVGVSVNFTKKEGTRCVASPDILWANKIIVVSETHNVFINGMLHLLNEYSFNPKPPVLLIPLHDRRYSLMPREEFVSCVRAVMDENINRIERE